ncbi:MAG: hypothetical protein KC478_03405, partial [Bacteriovoracaceae bacterium]|nr:hypothetical protein [Bacteriovoracaceae bacterium]
MHRSIILVIVALTSLCSMGHELAFSAFIGRTTGNEVLGQTISIGLFLLFMGLGSLVAHFKQRPSFNKLFCLELSLSALGFFIPTILKSSLGLLSALGLVSDLYPPISNSLIIMASLSLPLVVIGLLTGIELPWLLEVYKNEVKDKELNKIFFFNYLGSLLAGVFICMFLLEGKSSEFKFIFFACLNSLVCVLMLVQRFDIKKLAAVCCVLIFGKVLSLAYPLIDKFAVHSNYYGYEFNSFELGDVKSFYSVLQNFGKVERVHTPYQTLDIVHRRPLKYRGVAGQGKVDLYLNEKIQFSTFSYEVYHETFSHGLFNLMGRVPKSVLVLGGGDGILVKELLKREEIEAIKIVELDEKVIEVTHTHPVISTLNEGALYNDKVDVIYADAFTFLGQEENIEYDAIFVDFPYPNSDELKKLYSLEFYTLLKNKLTPNGMAIVDVPVKRNVNDGQFSRSARTIVKTMQASGFRGVHAIGALAPFIVLTQQKSHLNFDYDLIKKSNFISRSSYLNLIKLDISSIIDSPTEEGDINSIFKPGQFKNVQN